MSTYTQNTSNFAEAQTLSSVGLRYYKDNTHSPTLPTECSHCGSEALALSLATSPHAARLDCEGCERWLKWVSKVQAEQLGLMDGGLSNV